ncbi:MAG: hypothetical protein OEZ10_14400 [Gammaproteobacteria bacterium]|nr:hypothetical protein [Gammaproteobacteria bacterium]
MSAILEAQHWSLADRVDVMLALAETETEFDPELRGEDAAMIFMGDVYVLRDDPVVTEDGWGKRHYTADWGKDPL